MFNISPKHPGQSTDDVIYKEFRDSMRNQACEQVRLAGDLVKSVVKKTSLTQTINNFSQLDQHLENIENNLNKVRVLTRQTRS